MPENNYHNAITPGYETLVQAIVILPTGHTDICQAAAMASTQVIGHILQSPSLGTPWKQAPQLDLDRTKQWLTHGMPKEIFTIRKPSQVEQLNEAITYHRLLAAQSHSANTLAIAFAPMYPSELPREVRRLSTKQINTSRIIDPQTFTDTSLHIRINPKLKESTTQTAIHATHAANLYLLKLNTAERNKWITNPNIKVTTEKENRSDVLLVEHFDQAQNKLITAATVNLP